MDPPFDQWYLFNFEVGKLDYIDRLEKYEEVEPRAQNWTLESRGLFYVGYCRDLRKAGQNAQAIQLAYRLIQQERHLVDAFLFSYCVIVQDASDDPDEARRFYLHWQQHSGFDAEAALDRRSRDKTHLLSKVLVAAPGSQEESLFLLDRLLNEYYTGDTKEFASRMLSEGYLREPLSKSSLRTLRKMQ